MDFNGPAPSSDSRSDITVGTSPRVSRRISVRGVLAMAIGLFLLVTEWQYGLLSHELKTIGWIATSSCAILLSVWGLKEIIAEWWPELGRRGLGRISHIRMAFPRAGQLYVVVLIVLFVASIIGKSNPLLLVFSMAAAPFVLNGQLTYMLLRRVTAARHAPVRAMVGQPISIGVSVTNNGRWFSRWGMTLRDRVQGSGYDDRAEVMFFQVPPRQTSRGAYQVNFTARGRYTLGPLQVTTRFPLGLSERALHLALLDEILVYPKMGRLSSRWRHTLHAATESAGQLHRRVGTVDDEYHRIREYLSGDDLRAIHWRTTARKNELMVREFHESRESALAVLLDLGPSQPDHVERAVSLAATVSYDHMRSSPGTHLFVAALGSQLYEWGGVGRRHDVDSLLDIFSVIEPHNGASLQTLFDSFSRGTNGNETVMLITTRDTEHLDWMSDAESADGDVTEQESRLGGNGTATISIPRGLQVLSPSEQLLSEICDFPE